MEIPVATLGIRVGNPSGRQIGLDHLCGLIGELFVPTPECLGPQHSTGEEGLKCRTGFGPQRQRILAPAFAVGGRHIDGMRLEIKRRDLEHTQLFATQPCLNRNPIEQCPLATGHPEAFRLFYRHGQKAADFIDFKRYSIVSPVRSNIHALQVRKWRLRSPPILHHPATELLGGLQIEIRRLCREPLATLPKSGEMLLDLAGGDLAPGGKLAALHHGLRPGEGQFGMLGGVSLGQERLSELLQMLLERPCPMRFVAIHNTLVCQSRFLDQAGLKLFGGLLVCVAGHTPDDPIGVTVLDVPLRRLPHHRLAIRPFDSAFASEDCHRKITFSFPWICTRSAPIPGNRKAYRVSPGYSLLSL
ncbi:MAG: hypothetical protein QM570_02910 [Planctomycetota bacterium]|nr:hypothetical protein [Planctomycetota bacterium]